MKPAQVVFGTAAVLALAAWLIFRPAEKAQLPPIAAIPTTSARLGTGSKPLQTGVPSETIDNLVAGLSQRLKLLPGREVAAAALAGFRKELLAMPRDQALARLTQFLDSREDAPTQLGFAVGPGGVLTESPTVRVYLLDLLAEIDPVSAAAYAETVLATSASADEWAVAMRNLARGRTDDAGKVLLRERFTQLLHNPDWLEHPTAGFLEAFDVAVHLRSPALVPDLMALVNTNAPQAAAHAAHLALDRMIQGDPVPALAALLRDPAGLPGHDLTRAGYVARANVAEPQQRQLVEAYLLNPQLGAEELMAFAEGFPNANFMMSHNLITTSDVPASGVLVQRDRQALQVVQSWLKDPRFASRRAALEIMRDRLTTFVEQASHP
jgi:hypothetical protein